MLLLTINVKSVIKVHMKTFFKTMTCLVVLRVLYRALKVLARKDSRIRHEFASFADGFIIKITLSENGDSVFMKKEEGRLVFLKHCESEDLELKFKSVDSAFLVFTGIMGISRAYAEHRIIIKGDISDTMTLVRIIDIAEAYLFPHIMTKRILRSVPSKERSTLSVYRMVLLGF